MSKWGREGAAEPWSRETPCNPGPGLEAQLAEQAAALSCSGPEGP